MRGKDGARGRSFLIIRSRLPCIKCIVTQTKRHWSTGPNGGIRKATSKTTCRMGGLGSFEAWPGTQSLEPTESERKQQYVKLPQTIYSSGQRDCVH
jgi:hypothetical protein